MAALSPTEVIESLISDADDAVRRSYSIECLPNPLRSLNDCRYCSCRLWAPAAGTDTHG